MIATPEAITHREVRGSARLWFGVLGAPTAWAIALVVGYSLEEWFACSPATTDEGTILGFGVRPLATAVSTAMFLVAVGAGIVAWRCLARIRSEDDPTIQRARWMAIAGVMNSILYALAIVVTLLVPLLLRVCETTP